MLTRFLFWLNLGSGIYQSIVIYGQAEPKLTNIIVAGIGFFISGLLLGQKH